MKRVLVTGASGFVGRNLVKCLSKHGLEVYAVVRNEANGLQLDVNDNIHVISCDMKNIALLKDKLKNESIEACIHLAWDGVNGDKRADYELQLDNIRYTLNLIDILSEIGVRKFVGVGTLAEKDILNYHLENMTTPNPVSIYGCAKIATHLMAKTECNKKNVEFVWCQLSNTYGVGNTTNNFVNMAIDKMLNGKRASFTSGEQLYDFVYIEDAVEALYLATVKGINNCSYYVGSGSPRKLYEYIYMIRDTIDKSIPVYLGEIPYNGKSLDLESYDISNLQKDTGYEVNVAFEKGIEMTVQWLKGREK